MAEDNREHTTHYESCGCAEAKIGRLEARVRELEAALTAIEDRIAPTGDPDVDADRDERRMLVNVQRIAARALRGDADDLRATDC